MKDQFTEIAGNLLIRAPAKLNLSLLIAGKRPDGYHEIETVMAKVDWYDELLFEPGAGDRFKRWMRKSFSVFSRASCWVEAPMNGGSV